MAEVIRREFRAVSYNNEGDDPYEGSIALSPHEAHLQLADEWCLDERDPKRIVIESRLVRESEWETAS